MLCGLKRDLAARFSFLLSLPAIIGAMVIQLSTEGFEKVGPLPLIFGVIMATLVGLMALRLLMGIVRKGTLAYFAPYCWGIGLFIILN